MPSEKLKYIQPAAYDPKIHIPALETVLSAHPDQRLLRKLREDVIDSDYRLYEMAAEFLPLTHAETLALLKGYIAFQIEDLYVIPQAVESDIETFTDLLMMERYKQLLKAGHLEEAVGVLCAIIMAIEPEYGNVEDEGITFHQILEDAFEELDKLVVLKMKKEITVALHQQISGYYQQMKTGEQFYEQEWEEVIAKLEGLI